MSLFDNIVGPILDSNPLSGLVRNVKQKVSTVKNIMPMILIGGGITAIFMV